MTLCPAATQSSEWKSEVGGLLCESSSVGDFTAENTPKGVFQTIRDSSAGVLHDSTEHRTTTLICNDEDHSG